MYLVRLPSTRFMETDDFISAPSFFFFYNATATTEIYTAQYTLSLHDALPILRQPFPVRRSCTIRAALPGHGSSAAFQARLQARIPPSSDTASRPRARNRSAASMLVFPAAHTVTTRPPFVGWKAARAVGSPRRNASYASTCTLPGMAHSARSAAGRTSRTVTGAPRSSSSRRPSVEMVGAIIRKACSDILSRPRLARVVFRIHVGDAPGPDAVELEDDPVASGPRGVHHFLWHHGVTAGQKRRAARIGGLLAHPHVERAGEHGHVLEHGVPVRRRQRQRTRRRR